MARLPLSKLSYGVIEEEISDTLGLYEVNILYLKFY